VPLILDLHCQRVPDIGIRHSQSVMRAADLRRSHMCLVLSGQSLAANSAHMLQTWVPNYLNLKSCFLSQH